MFVRLAILVIACVTVVDARPPKPPLPPATGYLSIDSGPSAVIEIDGKQIGKTPVLKLKLVAGRHTVRAVRENGDAQRFDVTINTGVSLEYRLDWDGGGLVDANGYLTIQSTPAAQIWIDSTDIQKTTPVDKLALKPGRHKVAFVIGGDRYTFSVNIVAGQTTVMTKTF